MKISFEFLILTFGQMPFPHLPLPPERLLKIRAAYLFSTLSMDTASASVADEAEAAAEAGDNEDDDDDDEDEEAEA